MIAAVMACLNEAHYLEKSLKQLAFCDEILVVDLGSHDDSVAVASQHGARVIHHEWVPFRELIIQEMIAQVHHDWVLMVDPDLIFPPGIEAPLKNLIAECEPQGLGMIYMPMVTCFNGQPLRYGQKSGRRAYRAVVHRERVTFADLLHHKGVHLREGYTAACLRPAHADDLIQHFWIDNLHAAEKKAARYLPHEGRTRAAQGQSFSWRGAVGELFTSLLQDLRRGAFLEWHAVQVMAFQAWYTWQANLALRDFEREKTKCVF